MSSKRPPSAPPAIQGYEYKRLIGSGGFADVFLYQEFRPRRQVAIKVLLPQWSDGTTREAFAAEADLMAAVSSHPSIVTIFDSDVTEDGRLYLAMEYCSRPNLSSRYKKERLGIAETLRIGVQIAGAVETAHRSGIVHRDIKPANILVTDYGHPALTDFGISATIEQSEAGADGMSVPWSPPENLTATPRSGITTDVWSLAATVYTLLAGRSPFEVPGGVNTQRALIERITNDPLPPIGRGDVPASLERVLAVAMAKSPDMRYPTMLELGRELQQIQMELSLATTSIDILEGSSSSDGPVVRHEQPSDDGDDDGGTRMRLATDRFHPAYGVAHSSQPARRPASSLPPGAVADSGSIGHDSASMSYGSINGMPYIAGLPGAGAGTATSGSHGSQATSHTYGSSQSYVSSQSYAQPGTGSAQHTSGGQHTFGHSVPPHVASHTGRGPSGHGTATASAGRWRRGGRPWWQEPVAMVAAAAVVLGIGGGVLVYDAMIGIGGAPSADVPAPADLTVSASGSVAVFVWSNPDPQEGDFYAYRPRVGEADTSDDEGAAATPLKRTTAQTASVNAFGVDSACLEVVIVREGRLSTERALTCLE